MAKIDKTICEEFCKWYDTCDKDRLCERNAFAAKVRKVTAGKARRWVDEHMWELDDNEKNSFYEFMGTGNRKQSGKYK